jgi:hyperosmotically inducible protein
MQRQEATTRNDSTGSRRRPFPATLLLLAFLASACSFGPKVVAREDAAITADISGQLAAEPQLSDYDLDVDTSDAVVTVSGTVRNDADRRTTEEIARSTAGVREVDNRVRYDSKAFPER